MKYYEYVTIDDAIKTIRNDMHTKNLIASDLLPIELPDTRSEIVADNNYRLYGCCYSDLGGVFTKDPINSPYTTRFGRVMCDSVKKSFKNNGFFTTDELPRYGITRAEKRKIYLLFNATSKDLITLYAYNKEDAIKINEYVKEKIGRLLFDQMKV